MISPRGEGKMQRHGRGVGRWHVDRLCRFALAASDRAMGLREMASIGRQGPRRSPDIDVRVQSRRAWRNCAISLLLLLIAARVMQPMAVMAAGSGEHLV